MLARDPLIKRITAVLAKLESYLKLLSAQNLNDGAVLFEDTCVPLLNCVYGLALKNANAEAANFPAADLIARDARRAFQITINDTTAKIRSTHDKAAEHNLAAVVDKLTIFFVVAKAPAEPEENSKFSRCTSPDIDTLDLTRLITHIRSLELDHISKIADILDREISPKIPEEKRAIPAICNLPFESIGDLFVGRDKFQDDLHASVATSGATVIRSKQAIHGMGGVGKTRAAVEYGWQHGSEYSALLFITADSPANLRTNLVALYEKHVLKLPEQAAIDFDTQIAAATHWLKINQGWFLILDNVDTEDARDAVREFTAQIPHGHILITSRLAEWPAGFTALDLDVLDEPASIRFLLDHTAGRRTERAEDSTVAELIARHLDGLALALEQAAAWVRKGRRTLGHYLVAWANMNIHLHQTQLTNWVGDYPRSLLTTYRTSTSQLSDDAKELFRILSWLAPDPLPTFHLDNLKNLPDPQTLLVELADLHLARLTPDGTSITVHRMLQAIEQAQQLVPPMRPFSPHWSGLTGNIPTIPTT